MTGDVDKQVNCITGDVDMQVDCITSDVDTQVDSIAGDVDAQVDYVPIDPMPTPYEETSTKPLCVEALFLVGACTASSASPFV